MILLLDCGNTLAKFAWLKNDTRSPAKALAYKELDELTEHIKHTPKQVFGANVASQGTKN